MNTPAVQCVNFGIHQQAFMLFFAIFWGNVANVQPRWKAFQFPLMFKPKLWTQVLPRVILAVILFNVLPILYFGLILFWTHKSGPLPEDTIFVMVSHVIIQGIVPAFGMFGFYRFWLAALEFYPNRFYKSKPSKIPEEYKHVEPTYRLRWDDNDKKKRPDGCPVVELGKSGWGNLSAAVVYLFLGLGAGACSYRQINRKFLIKLLERIKGMEIINILSLIVGILGLVLGILGLVLSILSITELKKSVNICVLQNIRTQINRLEEDKGKQDSPQRGTMHHTQQALETLFKSLKELFRISDEEAPL